MVRRRRERGDLQLELDARRLGRCGRGVRGGGGGAPVGVGVGARSQVQGARPRRLRVLRVALLAVVFPRRNGRDARGWVGRGRTRWLRGERC